MSKKKSSTLARYAGLLNDIKSRIRQAQTRAMLSVNAELVRLYWDIGRMVQERQAGEGYGTRVVERLAGDLHNDLPEVKGFSERNIKRMLAFHRAYPSPELVVPQAVAQPVPTQFLPKPVAQLQRASLMPPAAAPPVTLVPQPVAQPPSSLL